MNTRTRQLIVGATLIAGVIGCSEGDPASLMTTAGVRVVDREVVLESLGAQRQLSVLLSGSLTSGSVVSWSSLDPSVVEVSSAADGSGRVVAVAPGTAKVVARLRTSADTVQVRVEQRVAELRLTPVGAVALSALNDTVRVHASAHDANGFAIAGAGAAVTWESRNAAVAAVDGSGLVRAVGPGQAQLVASHGSASAQVGIIVLQTITQVVIGASAPAFTALGQFADLSATALDRLASPVIGAPIVWRNLTPGIVDVSSTGRVTARANGAARVEASSAGVSDTVDLVVKQQVARVVVQPGQIAVAAGDTLHVSARPEDSRGNVVATPVHWSSSAPSIVHVDSTGLVHGLAVGTAVLVAEAEGHTATAVAQVVGGTTTAGRVTVTGASVRARECVTLTATVFDAAGAVLTGRPVAWSSANPLIATVDATGRVCGVAPGTAVIQAAADGSTGLASVTVTPAAVASVVIQPGAATLVQGGSISLTAVALDAATTPIAGRPVTWTSSAPQVATVSPTGVVSALALGSAVITATVDGVAGTATITVQQIATSSLSLAPATLTLNVGQTQALTATPRDAAGAVIQRPVTFSSSASQVAAVSASGVVTAIAGGSATITASSDGRTATSVVTVVAAPLAPVASVTIAPASPTVSVGASLTLSAVTRDAAGSVLTGRAVTWSSATPAVAQVSSAGVVSGIAAGTSVITATSEGRSSTVTVTVSAPPAIAVRISPKADTLRAIGATRQLTAQAVSAQGSAVPGAGISWSSSNIAVASVDQGGIVQAKAPGIAFIIAACLGCSSPDTASVVVAPSVTQVVLTPTAATLNIGAATPLTAAALDANGHPVAGVQVSWSTSAPSVATVDASGTVRAVGAGTATITASTGTINGTATVTVSAVPLAPVASITITPSTATISAGASTTLGAATLDAAGAVLTGRIVSWTTSNAAVALVAAGIVTGVTPGTAVITATSEGKSASATVTITALSAGSCEAAAGGHCYYIAVNGSTSGSGSVNSPFATYAQAHAVLRAGDVLYYRGGVYTNIASFIQYSTSLNGAAGQRITIKSYPGERAVFDNQGRNGSLAYIGGQGAIVEGFEFRNSSSHGTKPAGFIDGWTQGVAIWGNYATFRRNWIHHITGDAANNGGSLRLHEVTNTTVHNNAFTDLIMPSPVNGARHNVEHLIIFEGGNNVTHSNYFSHSATDGQGCYYQKHGATSPGTVVYNNTFENCSGMGVNINGSQPYSVHHNLFINSTAGSPVDGAANVVWESNTFYGDRLSFLDTKGSPHTFRNNIVYQTVGNFTLDGQATLRISHYGDDSEYSSATANDVFQNNCYFNAVTSVKMSYFGGTPSTTGGIFTLAQLKAIGLESGSLEVNPQFVNIAGRDFHALNASCSTKGAYAGGSYAPPLSPSAARGW